MKITSNVDVSRQLAERFARQLMGGVFDASLQGAAGIAVALETAGPDDGVGVCTFFYDILGQWKSVRVRNDEQMHILEQWVEDTYPSVGSWTECLVQVVVTDDEAAANFEFDFDNANRWRSLTQGDALPDVLRPRGLPIPIGRPRGTVK